MKAIRIRRKKRGKTTTKIVKETNDYFDWYKNALNNWEVVEEFEV